MTNAMLTIKDIPVLVLGFAHEMAIICRWNEDMVRNNENMRLSSKGPLLVTWFNFKLSMDK